MSTASSGGRVVLVGEFGCGNRGNDGSLEVVARYLAERHPGLAVECLARNPDVVHRDLGLTAHALQPRSGTSWRRKVGGRLTDPVRYGRRFRGATAVVVPGMGVLESELGVTAFGMPFLMAQLALIALLVGTRFVLLDVGVSEPRTRLARLFTWVALRTSAHRSFRDLGSWVVAQSHGARATDAVVPDLAFAMHAPGIGRGDDADAVRVGVGVIDFWGRHPDPDPGVRLAARERYLDTMTDVLRQLLSDDTVADVVLLTGDDLDVGVAELLRDRAAATGSAPTVSTARRLGELEEEMADLDVVVASRYHNLVCAVAVGVPSISLSYAEKCRQVVEDAGMHGMHQSLDELDGERLLQQLAHVRAQAPRYRAVLQASRERRQRALDGELRRLDALVAPAHRRRAPRPVRVGG